MTFAFAALLGAWSEVNATTEWEVVKVDTDGTTDLCAKLEQGEDASTSCTLELETSPDGENWYPAVSEQLSTDGDAAATASIAAGPETSIRTCTWVRARIVVQGSTIASGIAHLVSDAPIKRTVVG